MRKYVRHVEPVSRSTSIADRIRAYSSPIEQGCWEWQAARTLTGYGLLHDPSLGRMRGAHRLAYEALVGPIPEGLHIDHLCNNRACVNPEHLEAVTLEENMRRVRERNSDRGSCRRGHPHDLNSYIGANGYRRCRACAALTARLRKSVSA